MNSAENPSYPNPTDSIVNVSRSGTAFNSADLNSINPSPFSASTVVATSLDPSSSLTTNYRYNVVNDSVPENDETFTFTLTGINTADSSGYTVGTPSSVTVIIRGTDSAPSFGMVSAQAFTHGVPITEFQIPIGIGGNEPITYTATDLPAGLTFDAEGNGDCPGTEPREICGTPTAVTAGA